MTESPHYPFHVQYLFGCDLDLTNINGTQQLKEKAHICSVQNAPIWKAIILKMDIKVPWYRYLFSVLNMTKCF